MTEPRWLAKARTYLGVEEAPGADRDNATIIAWAKKLGGWVASYFKHDAIPWCGLFIGLVMSESGFKDLPPNLLGALNWNSWGTPLKAPSLGAILTFTRNGGGHVAFYVGEDKTHFHVLGGNQSNKVSITRIAKNRLSSIRWPVNEPVPVGGRVYLDAKGAPVSTNEA